MKICKRAQNVLGRIPPTLLSPVSIHKEPYVPAKESYKSAKEPYKSAKEPCKSEKEPKMYWDAYLQLCHRLFQSTKSPMSPQKSRMNLEKSHVNLEKSHENLQKSPKCIGTHTSNSAIACFNPQRALCPRKRVI